MFYKIRGDVFELVDDGRLVCPVDLRFFRSDQVDAVLKEAVPVDNVAEYYQQQIVSITSRRENLQESLRYADGGAYYQDKARIRECGEEIFKIKRYLERLNERS